MSHTPLDCPTARQHLALYAGRDLEPSLNSAVEHHLEHCAACARELAGTQAARERIAIFGAHQAAASEAIELWPALQARLTTSQVAPQPARRATALRRWGWLPASLAAAAALVMVLRNDPPAPATGPGAQEPAGAPVAISVGADQSAALISNAATPVNEPGSLRRAVAGEERLRDSSLPLYLPLRTLLQPGGAGAANSLASDGELR